MTLVLSAWAVGFVTLLNPAKGAARIALLAAVAESGAERRLIYTGRRSTFANSSNGSLSPCIDRCRTGGS
ncbi:MAG: hypothetical protein QGM47_07795, partial [Actinomycetota bacterium]|nr:hypothetical protein [Actinomycetota bacterium]